MCMLPVKVVITLILGIVCAKGEVTVENGGYSNVLVSFSQSVEADDAKALLANLRIQLEEASQVLQNAIGLRISKVTVRVPKSWNTEDWDEKVQNSPSNQKDSKADILIGNTNDTVFGYFPHTQQFGSCGTPGRQLIIPADFLTAEITFPKGAALAREWLKYRYGVFDENGYPGDDLYPLYYSVPGDDPANLIVTDCSNTPIEYNLHDNYGNNCTDEKLNSKCRAEPSKESLENVTSSLMYFHKNIPNMKHVCGKDPEHHHNALARNKHNAFCQGQSVWDVLQNSSDFLNPEFLVDEMATEGVEAVEFIYVQEPSLKVVIAWETVEKIADQGPTIVKAIRKFVYDLPMGSKRALIPFDDEVAEGIEFRELVNRPIDWISTIASDFKDPTDGCVKCAVEKALDILEKDKSGDEDPEGIIILIATSNMATDNDLLQRITNSKACLMLLDFSNAENGSPDQYKQLVEASSCGTLVEFTKDSTEVEIFEKMFQAMESILPEAVNDRVTKTVTTAVIKPESFVDISVDSTVEKVTFWIFGNNNKIKYLNVKSDTGKDLQLNDETKYDETKSDDNMLAASCSPTHAGTLKFKHGYKSDVFVQVRTTSKLGQYANGEVFTHDLTEAESSTQEPVILYANIRYGAYPVQNAEVQANVSRPEAEDVILKMYDDGAGDPDITANDGVYSRYFTDFSRDGDYTVIVSVETDEKTTRAGKLTNGGSNDTTCCGQSVTEGDLSIPKFTKTFQTTFRAKSGRPENGYKPSRIVDLRVVSAIDNTVILQWTAPGGEADNGTAKDYEMKLFCDNEENFVDCNLLEMVSVLEKPTPMNYGMLQQVTIQILNTSFALAIGIIAVNNHNHESDLSNIVQILRPFTIESEITTTTPEPPNDPFQSSPVGKIIGYTLVGIVILICIMGAIIFFYKKKLKNKELHADDIVMNMNKDNHEVKNFFYESCDFRNESNVRRVESFPVLLYTHDQIKDYKEKSNDQPLYKVDVQPKPWMSLDELSSMKRKERSDNDNKSLGSTSTGYVNSS